MVCLRGESLTTHRNQMKLFKAIAATAAVITFSLGNGTPAQSFEYEVDRFTGTETSKHTQKGSGCVQTKGIKGKANLCLFMNSTESDRYPIVSIMKINNGWELLDTADRNGSAPAIVTLTNGQIIRTKIPATLSTSVGHGGSVYEWVQLALGKTDLPVNRIKKIEAQYGSAEFAVTPDRQAICVLNRAKSC